MIDFTTEVERKRCKQLNKVQDIVQEALDCLGRGIDTRAVTYKLLKLRNYLNKQFPDKKNKEHDDSDNQPV